MTPFPGNETKKKKKKKERDISTFVEHVHKIMAFFYGATLWFVFLLAPRVHQKQTVYTKLPITTNKAYV